MSDLIDRAEAQTELRFAARRYTVANEAHGEGKVVWSDDLISVTDAMNVLRALPSAQPKIIRCKECKHYHTDVFGQELGIEGIYGNLIVAHNACDKWTKHMNSVDPDGFCFLAERRTDAAK